MQKYIASSKYEPYDRKTKKGYWRLIQVRDYVSKEGKFKKDVKKKLKVFNSS